MCSAKLTAAFDWYYLKLAWHKSFILALFIEPLNIYTDINAAVREVVLGKSAKRAVERENEERQ